jgi:soluble lytic murein transglycosylase-like protein
MQPTPLLLELVRSTAQRHGLDPVLVAAICQKESSWDPLAIRFEPEYRWLWPSRENVFRPMLVSAATEVAQQKMSWGLMQVMGAVARERGCRLPYLSALCSPAHGLEYGCAHLAWMAQRYAGNDLISAYNAGRPVDFNRRIYVDPVLENMEALRSQVEV